MEVYKAINKVQSELATIGIQKNRKNTQGQGYSFRGIDDIYNALSSLIGKHGLCVLPRILSRSCEERQSKSGGALFYVTVEAEFDFVSSQDGSKHVVKTFGEAMDSSDKATNKAMSAAYKYACLQAFCIPTEGDNDSENQTPEVKPKITPTAGVWESLSEEERNKLTAVAVDVIHYLESNDELSAANVILDANLDADKTVALWTRFNSGQRAKLRKAKEQLDEMKGNK